ncbi:hypothetical protein ACH5RR_016453 [Cinchona calisaya]|uniref:RING-type domain-containing protein n=1 Tax=Cinchona calisaya TaxID=153742 RepID=A0ABD2ZW13_9GENT
MMSSGINLVMTVIGFTVSIMFIVFVCTRLICARIQLNASRRSFARANRSDISILERGLHGLEPVIFANFPMKKYSDSFFSSGENNQCTVCLADYHKEDTLRILPSCGHYFHAACIDMWLYNHSTCPVCRISLRELPEKKRFMQPLFSSAIRTQYSMQPTHLNAFHCSSNSHRISSMLHDNQRMETRQEECYHSDRGGVGGGESNTILLDDCQTTKKSENKQVESPSNA